MGWDFDITAYQWCELFIRYSSHDYSGSFSPAIFTFVCDSLLFIKLMSHVTVRVNIFATRNTDNVTPTRIHEEESIIRRKVI